MPVCSSIYMASMLALRFMSALLLAILIQVLALSTKGDAADAISTFCGIGMTLKSAFCPIAVLGRRKATAAIAPVKIF